MVLYMHSDASYLSETRTRSPAAGHSFLSDTPVDLAEPSTKIPSLNGPVHTMCKIIDVVVGSAAEAEIGAGYLNGQDAVPIITTLTELGHSQPPTLMQVDNTTAEGFANGTMKHKRSKAMDMRWHWIKDRTRLGQFLVYYRPGKDNLADPFTKQHTPVHIKAMKPKFVHHTKQLANVVIHHLVRRCVNPVGTRRHVCPRTSTELSPHKVTNTTNPNIVPAPNKWRSRAAH
jgi:hypothetical protein